MAGRAVCPLSCTRSRRPGGHEKDSAQLDSGPGLGAAVGGVGQGAAVFQHHPLCRAEHPGLTAPPSGY